MQNFKIQNRILQNWKASAGKVEFQFRGMTVQHVKWDQSAVSCSWKWGQLLDPMQIWFRDLQHHTRSPAYSLHQPQNTHSNPPPPKHDNHSTKNPKWSRNTIQHAFLTQSCESPGWLSTLLFHHLLTTPLQWPGCAGLEEGYLQRHLHAPSCTRYKIRWIQCGTKAEFSTRCP